MTKTANIDVTIEVRKVGPDQYEFAHPNGDWSGPFSEDWARIDATRGYHGSCAIVKAIDSGAFADPLPTATGAHIYNLGSKVHFFRIDSTSGIPWVSSGLFAGRLWHTPKQVQSYGPFEVLYDPENMES